MTFETLIDTASLADLLENPAAASAVERRPILLDCRFDLANPEAGREAFRRAHLPGAHYADLNRDLSGPMRPDSGRHPLPEPGVASAFFASLGISAPDGPQVVAYDDAGGQMAARAWWLLRWLGYDSVAVLDGGFGAWVAGGGAVESGVTEFAAIGATAPAAQPPVEVRAAMAVGVAEVLVASATGDRLLIDARAPERFAGAREPLDTVAGHVPGAVNHPFTANLDSQGRFLSAEALRRSWLARLRGTAAEDAILMCGSGVTACHNLLAMAHAGLPGGRLYAGSWSEWIRDPDRPVARGGPQ